MSSRLALLCSCPALCICLWLCSWPAFAESEPVLTARPGLCIIEDRDTRECVMGVELSWEGPAGDYCLYQSNTEAPLQCWQASSEGGLKARLESAGDVYYWLQRPPSEQRLAEVRVRVLSLAQRRTERRRRRHAWAPI